MKKTVCICGAVLAIAVIATVAIGTSNSDVRPTEPAKLALARQSMMDKFHTGDADALAAYAIRQADEAWHDQGNYPLAVEWLKVAAAADPADTETYSDIAWLQQSMSEDTEKPRSHRWWYARYAVCTLRQGIAANPMSAEAHYNLGQHYFVAKQYRMAEKWLAEANALGTDLQGQKAYAHCLEKQGRFEQALAVWQGMDQSGPAVASNRNKIARIVEVRAGRTPWQRARDSFFAFIG